MRVNELPVCDTRALGDRREKPEDENKFAFVIEWRPKLISIFVQRKPYFRVNLFNDSLSP